MGTPCYECANTGKPAKKVDTFTNSVPQTKQFKKKKQKKKI